VEQDLLALLDELEGFFSEAGRIPLTGKLMVNEDEVFEIIDRLRRAIPEALHQAQRTNRERERLMQQAREEGEAIVQEARAYADKLVRESAIVQRAQEEADRILDEARRVSREIRVGAREYADDLLEKVEANIHKVLTIVRQGRQELGPASAAEAQAAAAADGSSADRG
jgi:cell division septum initiation protein DivIVA